MKGSNSKMLQIALKWQLPAPKYDCKKHQNVANSWRFKSKNAANANAVEIAPPSSKRLQIARKMDTINNKQNKKTDSSASVSFPRDWSVKTPCACHCAQPSPEAGNAEIFERLSRCAGTALGDRHWEISKPHIKRIRWINQFGIYFLTLLRINMLDILN
jgi:hypothetical protein